MRGNGPLLLDHFKQEQDENDEQNERESTAAVVAEPRTHAIAAKAEQQDQNNEKDQHLYFSVQRNFAYAGMMQIFNGL
jgi:hypothetical protein